MKEFPVAVNGAGYQNIDVSECRNCFGKRVAGTNRIADIAWDFQCLASQTPNGVCWVARPVVPVQINQGDIGTFRSQGKCACCSNSTCSTCYQSFLSRQFHGAFLILASSALKVMVPDVFNGQRQIVQRAAVD